MNTTKIIVGDALESLHQLEANSVHCCVTSPPYWGLRDYGCEGQIGLEPTFDEFLGKLLAVFAEVRRVLRPDGTLWVNIGDSYTTDAWGGGVGESTLGGSVQDAHREALRARKSPRLPYGLPPKNLVGQPWRLAFALQDAGWWLRSDCIWHKPNPMPESVTDRPTKAHEYVFMLTKSERYYFDQEAVKEQSVTDPEKWDSAVRGEFSGKTESMPGRNSFRAITPTRNIRTVWTIPSEPTPLAHFATFPSELPRRCIKASTSEYGCCASCGAPWERVMEILSHAGHKSRLDEKHFSGGSGPHASNVKQQAGWKPTCDCQGAGLGIKPCTVLDPFGGAGTTGLVANRLGRDAILLELNPEYAAMAARRINADQPMYFRADVTRSKRNAAAQQKNSSTLLSVPICVETTHGAEMNPAPRNTIGLAGPVSSDPQPTSRGGRP